jgi:hypothetical protein
MKLVARIGTYGVRAIAHLSWQRMTFFAGEDPPFGKMIAVELPGLASLDDDAVDAWIAAHSAGAMPRAKGTRSVAELPRETWRLATLDDVLEADNGQQQAYHAGECFPLEDFAAFWKTRVPELQRELEAVVAQKKDEARHAALEKIQERLARACLIVQQTQMRTWRDRVAIREALEKARIAALAETRPAPEQWLELALELQSPELFEETLVRVGRALTGKRMTQERIDAMMATLARTPELKTRVTYARRFWNAAAPALPLESNVTGETLDLSDAVETTVALGFDVLEARRVGKIVPGRTALVVTRPNERAIYVRAERKLKHRIARAGGKITKAGNTLVLSGGDGGKLRDALLEIERLDTLASVDPAQALEAVKELGLPETHPVFAAAREARADPRRARIFADLLIEIVIGIDPIVARGLVRNEARANRR